MVPAAAAVLAAIVGGLIGKFGEDPPPNTTQPPSSTSPSATGSIPATVEPTTSAPTASDQPSAPAAPETTSPTVWRAGDNLVIPTGYRIDLDKTAREAPDWDYQSTIFPSGIYVTGNGNLWTKSHLRVKSASDKAACVKTGYVETEIAAEEVTSGLVLCVKSSGGKYARVTVTQVDEKDHTVTINVLVWK